MAQLTLTNTDDNGVTTLSINRPDKHNAFNADIISELTQKLVKLDKHEETRIIVLTGEGKSFSSGADLNWMKSMVNYDEQRNYQDSLALAELMYTLYNNSKPTIAKINGSAFGGALGLISCCDLAVSCPDAIFCFSEVKLGIVPAVISPYIIAAIGVRHANRLFLTGETFSAAMAMGLGLINHVISKEEIDEYVATVTDKLLLGGPLAQSEVKGLSRSIINIDESIKDSTAKLIARLRVSEEGQEGLNAFLEKRNPAWVKSIK